MRIKIITSWKPGSWKQYAKRGIESMVENLPNEVDLFVYCEEAKPEYNNDRITWIDLHSAEPNLVSFKERHKNDPVANGRLDEIPNGVRRSPDLQTLGGQDKDKVSFLWDAVKFSNKVFCIINAVRNSIDHDYVVWLDSDTYTFKSMPIEFLESLLPRDTMLTYLGREKDNEKIYPECGFVGYNLKHPDIQNFINDWEQLYTTDNVFKLLEWHDSAVFWHLSNWYQQYKKIKINDIGYSTGVKGHHVFINSKLGEYIDHLKGDKRKVSGRSETKDFVTTQPYWRTA
jgi:hypothetical protein